MISNLGEVVSREASADHPWLIEVRAAGADRTITFAQLHAEADAVAAGLRRKGFERGDAIGLLAVNSARYLIAYIGIMRAGLVAVPVSIKLPQETIDHVHRDAGIGLMLADAEGAAKAPGLATLRIDDDSQWGALLAPGPFESVSMRAEEFATILYTSGSTGRPKGVPLTHGGYVWTIEQLAASGPPMQGKRALVAAPLFHMNALVISILAAKCGATTVLMQRFSGADYLKTAARLHCNVLTSVPTMLALAAREAELVRSLDLSHVESVFTGSAPSTDALFDRVAQMFPNARIMNGYGTTEAGPVVFGAHPQGLPRPKLSLGYPVPSVQWRLQDGPDATQGVLWLRSKAVMPGYLNLPQETGKRIHDGWYETGDVMRRDENGFFFFVGRNDDMFVCGGENIYPGEVEKLLETHPSVAQAVVVPVPDEIKGQLPVAFVVVKPKASLTEDELKQHALRHAPAYQHPRHVQFVDEMPLAGTNKVDRKLLMDQAARSFRR
jgi:acyl-CoA synthetase (AMP-forming)/AMP-acid ligase II